MTHLPTEEKRQRYRRGLRWAMALLAFVLIVPLIPYGIVAAEGQLGSNTADIWRDARNKDQRDAFRTQIQGIETAVLINNRGEQWRTFREKQLVPYGGYLLLGTLGLITAFFLFRGRIKIEGGRSGKLVPRFSSNQRVRAGAILMEAGSAPKYPTP